ncbi:MAG TPA: efflux RND transporter periplasmic adaptor subunit [Thermomicrobiaceae bacterium]|nr:efflux RND transporter periplasmic adaptor subunit [Thermomicrobiaceae bacterium]
MSRRRVWLSLLVVIIIAAIVAAAVYFVRGKSSPQTVTVQRGSIEATIQTVGQLAPTTTIPVLSQSAGVVQLVAVQPGDVVKQGDVLVQLNRQSFDQAISQAQTALDTAEAAVNASEQIATPTPQDLAQKLQAEQNLKIAQQAYNTAQSSLADSLILAPTDGTVLNVKVAANVPISQAQEVVDIANLQQLTLQLSLDETDIPHVSVGQTVHFTTDAYPGTQINGTLSRISPAATTSGGATSFQGTVTFTPPTGIVLRPGMNANVSIQTAVRKNVLVIPQNAIKTVGQRTFVTLLVGSKQEQREIQTGLSNNGMVEVASGLKAGDRLVLP